MHQTERHWSDKGTQHEPRGGSEAPCASAASRDVADDASTALRPEREVERSGTQIRTTDSGTGARDATRRQVEPADRRRATAPEQIRQTAEILFERVDPVNPASYRAVLRRDVRHFYAESVLGNLDHRLATAVTNGQSFYLQGAALGVGASMLTTDYARAFNFLAGKRRDPRRIVHVPFEEGINSLPKFFRFIARRARVSPDSVMIRHGGPDDYAAVVMQAAANNGVVSFILDHLSKLPPEVLSLVGTLMRYADPSYSVELDPVEGDFTGRSMSVILVDHHQPERLFVHAPDVLLHLGGAHAILPPYTTPREMAEAMIQADIGFDEVDLKNGADLQMVSDLLAHSRGLVAHMAPLLARVDAARQARRLARPDAKCVTAAIKDHRPLAQLHGVAIDGEVEYLTAANPTVARLGGATPDHGIPRPHANPPTPSAQFAVEQARELRKRNASRRSADVEGRALRRRQHTNLPAPKLRDES